MKVVKLWVLAAMAMMAFGAVGTAVASAEGDGPPQVLCFEVNCIQNMSGEFKGNASFLQDLNGLEITSETVSAKLENCKELAGSNGKDGNLCEPVTIDFTGAKSKGANCNTENDAAGVILVKTDVHLAAEENAAKELQPLVLFKVLNAPLIVKCGLIKEEFKGTIGCLWLPGLKEILPAEETTISCKQNATTHDAETGKCELLCTWLEEEALQAKIGTAFVDAWMNISAKGKLNKAFFIDD